MPKSNADWTRLKKSKMVCKDVACYRGGTFGTGPESWHGTLKRVKYSALKNTNGFDRLITEVLNKIHSKGRRLMDLSPDYFWESIKHHKNARRIRIANETVLHEIIKNEPGGMELETGEFGVT